MDVPGMARAVRAMTSKQIVLRADASLEIGTGHIMRCLTLANALRGRGYECHFICREHPGNLIEFIRAEGHHAYPLACSPTTASSSSTDEQAALAHAVWLGASQLEDAAACQQILEEIKPQWLVVDHYALDSCWESAVLSGLPHSMPRLLVIDDLADREHIADLLLDQNLGRQVEDYNGLVPEHCQVLAGPRYALLRPEFAEWRDASLARRAREQQLKQVLINLGGVDKDNVTGRILEALKRCDLPSDISISIVMGASAPWLEQVKAKAAELPWPTEVVVNVNDMARRMAEADLAIGAAGSTSWERCCLGLPTLMLVLAENQRDIALQLARSGASHTLDLTDLTLALVSQLAALACPFELAAMSKRAADLVEGKGTSHLLVSMQEACKGVAG